MWQVLVEYSDAAKLEGHLSEQVRVEAADSGCAFLCGFGAQKWPRA
jgi:hypothetical protein